jgi:two-component system chemotaxis response regulator CheY
LLQLYLSDYAACVVACDGQEAVAAFAEALDAAEPYDLVCLDVMTPRMDGHAALASIRRIESDHGIGGLDAVRVIMTTALDDSGNIFGAFRTGCEAYLIKPIRRERLLEEMQNLGLFAASG